MRYIYANVAQPMDKYLAKDDPLYRDVDLSDTTLNGKIYGIPGTWGIKGYMCVFNKTLFKEQKVKNPTELYLEGNWNYKTFLETAKKMTLYREDGKTVKTYGVGTWDYALLMYANGGKGLVEDGKGGQKATIDQPAEMGGLQLLYDLVSAGAFYTGDSYSGFGRRMIAMHLEQPWNAVGAYDYFNNMEDDIGIAPMPMANDGKYYFPKSSGGTFIPRNAKNPLGGVAYAYELAKFDNNRFFTSTNDYDVMQRRQCITGCGFENLSGIPEKSGAAHVIHGGAFRLVGYWIPCKILEHHRRGQEKAGRGGRLYEKRAGMPVSNARLDEFLEVKGSHGAYSC